MNKLTKALSNSGYPFASVSMEAIVPLGNNQLKASLKIVTKQARMINSIEIKGYDDFIVNLCPDGTAGEVNLLADIYIQFPKQPSSDLILFSNLPKEEQYWKRIEPPTDLTKIRSMDEWSEMPREFREKYSSYIKEEFRRRRHGVWFMNNGVPTYITGRHYMMLQWSKIDIGYPNYLAFQRDLFLHEAACELDPRSLGQLYTKCRRSGYTNMSASILEDEGTQVSDKLLGVMSKTGKDAQENVFMKKIFPVILSILKKNQMIS